MEEKPSPEQPPENKAFSFEIPPKPTTPGDWEWTVLGEWVDWSLPPDDTEEFLSLCRRSREEREKLYPKADE